MLLSSVNSFDHVSDAGRDVLIFPAPFYNPSRECGTRTFYCGPYRSARVQAYINKRDSPRLSAVAVAWNNRVAAAELGERKAEVLAEQEQERQVKQQNRAARQAEAEAAAAARAAAPPKPVWERLYEERALPRGTATAGEGCEVISSQRVIGQARIIREQPASPQQRAASSSTSYSSAQQQHQARRVVRGASGHERSGTSTVEDIEGQKEGEEEGFVYYDQNGVAEDDTTAYDQYEQDEDQYEDSEQISSQVESGNGGAGSYGLARRAPPSSSSSFAQPSRAPPPRRAVSMYQQRGATTNSFPQRGTGSRAQVQAQSGGYSSVSTGQDFYMDENMEPMDAHPQNLQRQASQAQAQHEYSSVGTETPWQERLYADPVKKRIEAEQNQEPLEIPHQQSSENAELIDHCSFKPIRRVKKAPVAPAETGEDPSKVYSRLYEHAMHYHTVRNTDLVAEQLKKLTFRPQITETGAGGEGSGAKIFEKLYEDGLRQVEHRQTMDETIDREIQKKFKFHPTITETGAQAKYMDYAPKKFDPPPPPLPSVGKKVKEFPIRLFSEHTESSNPKAPPTPPPAQTHTVKKKSTEIAGMISRLSQPVRRPTSPSAPSSTSGGSSGSTTSSSSSATTTTTTSSAAGGGESTSGITTVSSVISSTGSTQSPSSSAGGGSVQARRSNSPEGPLLSLGESGKKASMMGRVSPNPMGGTVTLLIPEGGEGGGERATLSRRISSRKLKSALRGSKSRLSSFQRKELHAIISESPPSTTVLPPPVVPTGDSVSTVGTASVVSTAKKGVSLSSSSSSSSPTAEEESMVEV